MTTYYCDHCEKDVEVIKDFFERFICKECGSVTGQEDDDKKTATN
jgi:uncharacterized Zn finger protein